MLPTRKFFSLTELLVALAILAMGLAATGKLLNTSRKIEQRNTALSLAVDLAEREMAQSVLELHKGAELADTSAYTGEGRYDGYQVARQVTASHVPSLSSGGSALIKVSVTVKWELQGREQSYSLHTLVKR